MNSDKISAGQAEEFALAISQIVRRVRARAPAELGDFSWTQKSVLSRLEKAGPATSAELARAEGVTPQSMGTAIAALEDMQLVERKADPEDGRQIVVRLTARGRSLRERSRAAKESWLAQALAKLDREERAILLKASDIMKRMAEKP
jgi:DNA-binding MarR family transcriptional regulator